MIITTGLRPVATDLIAILKELRLGISFQN